MARIRQNSTIVRRRMRSGSWVYSGAGARMAWMAYTSSSTGGGTEPSESRRRISLCVFRSCSSCLSWFMLQHDQSRECDMCIPRNFILTETVAFVCLSRLSAAFCTHTCTS